MRLLFLLYRKQFIENRWIVFSFLFLLFITFLITLYSLFNQHFNHHREGFRITRYHEWGVANIRIDRINPVGEPSGNDIEVIDVSYERKRLWEDVQIALLAISIAFILISSHWVIRQLNYSPQIEHYATLPLSIKDKFFFLISSVFLVLPFLCVALFCLAFLMLYPFLYEPLVFDAPFSFMSQLLGVSKWQPVFLFTTSKLFFSIPVFVLLSLQFRRMGFIKTLVAFAIFTLGLFAIFALLSKLKHQSVWFGEIESIEQFPKVYFVHYLVVLSLGILLTFNIYLRLKDKNY